MASLADLGPDRDLRWKVRWRDPDGRSRSKSFARKGDAQRYLTELAHRLDSGTYLDPNAGKVTIGALADEWLATVHATRKPLTAATYAEVYGTLVAPRWGRVPVHAIKHSEVSAWVATLAARLSPSRTRQAHRILAALLDTAVRDRRIPSNPARGVPLPKMPRTRDHRYLTHGQVAALADVTRTPRDRALVLTLAYTGLRWGEAAALTWGDLDTLHHRLHVRRAAVDVHGRLVTTTTKTHATRVVPVPRPAWDAIMALPDRDGLLFPSSTGGVLRNGSWRRWVLTPACQRAGLPIVTPHAFRHTAASLAVASGATVKAVQRMLGHASAAMTLDTYADLFDDDLDALAQRLTDAAEAAPAWEPPPSLPRQSP